MSSAAARSPFTIPEPKQDALMRAVGLVIMTYVWRLQDAFPILGKIRLPILAMLLMVVFFVTARHPWRKLSQLRSPIIYLCAAMLFVMFAGIPTSLWRGGSLSFALKEHVPNLVFMMIVAASIRSVRDVEWYALFNVYGAVVYAIIVNLFFHVGPDGRLGNLIYYDANDFALVIVATIPFAVALLRPVNRSSRRLLGLIALGLFMLAVVKSGSRGGFIAMVVVLTYVLLRYRALPQRLRLLAAVGGVGLIVALASGSYWDKIATIAHPESDYNWTDPVGRKAVWERGIGYMESHPILGIGVRSFPIAEGTLSEVGREMAAEGRGFKWSVAHNSYLEVGAELGVPGLILFLALWGATFYTLERIKPGRYFGPLATRREVALAQMLIGSFLGYMVAGLFVSAEYFSYLYFLLGLVVGLDKVLRLQRQSVMAMMAQRQPVRAPTPVPAVAQAMAQAMVPRAP